MYVISKAKRSRLRVEGHLVKLSLVFTSLAQFSLKLLRVTTVIMALVFIEKKVMQFYLTQDATNLKQLMKPFAYDLKYLLTRLPRRLCLKFV